VLLYSIDSGSHVTTASQSRRKDVYVATASI
jgi:hypothetical protein